MVKLKRAIGLLETTAYGIGIIIGAGIFVLIGEAAGIAGNSLWMSFIIGAIVASFTGLSYCELSAMYPKAAAEYIYTKKAFRNNLISFMLGWLIIWIGIASAATVALGFAGYFSGLVGYTSIVLIAIILIVVLSFLNFYGIKEAARFNIAFTAIIIFGLLLIISAGVGSWGKVNYLEIPFGTKGIFSAAALIFFAYLGFEHIVNVAEETRRPRKVLPRAILLAITITTLLYVLVSISAVSVVGWQELAQSKTPLALVASEVFGAKGFFLLSIIALFATASTVLIILIVIARIIYGMAKDGSLPRLLASIHPKRRTPWVAVLIMMIFSIGFTLIGKIEVVAKVTSLGAFIAFAFVNTSLIWLRFSKPKFERQFKVPLNIGKFPVLPSLGLLTCLFMISRFSLDSVVITLAIVTSGVVIFYLKKFIE